MADRKPFKPSIYDPPAPTRELVREEPTQLETTIRSARLSIFQSYNTSKAAVTSLVDKWISVEKNVESTIKEVAPKGEETVIPGAIYVGIAGMGGSILARNRMFPLRMISPLLAIGISGYYFLPETSRNILGLVRRWEEHVPVVWDVHQRVAKDIEHLKAETTREAKLVGDKLGISNK